MLSDDGATGGTDESKAGSDGAVEVGESNAVGPINPKVWICRKIPTLKKSKLSRRYADKYGIERKKSLDFFLFIPQSFMIELEVIK